MPTEAGGTAGPGQVKEQGRWGPRRTSRDSLMSGDIITRLGRRPRSSLPTETRSARRLRIARIRCRDQRRLSSPCCAGRCRGARSLRRRAVTRPAAARVRRPPARPLEAGRTLRLAAAWLGGRSRAISGRPRWIRAALADFRVFGRLLGRSGFPYPAEGQRLPFRPIRRSRAGQLTDIDLLIGPSDAVDCRSASSRMVMPRAVG